MSSADLVVIGAGPAGLAASLAAAECGLHVVLVDERPAPGGQYLGGRQPSATPAERQGRTLLDRLPYHSIDLRSQTVVWNLSPDLYVSLFGPQGADTVAARAVIVAGGGRERVLPFPGWTLPGVMTAGAAQLLVKNYGVTPGHRVLLAGSGPLLLPAASALAAAGATVVAVLEAGHPAAWLPQGPALAFSVSGGGRLAE
ncbi:MAG TPA: FAD/NAD(P)-binding oxidoreductase, partial [Anaerolineae bacterium]